MCVRIGLVQSFPKRSERAVAESDVKTKEQERRTLEAAPAHSDAAFSVFKKDLERIGWRHAPESKQAVTAQLVESLSDLTSQLKFVQRVDWLQGPVSIDTIAKESSALLRASTDVQAPVAAAKEDEQRRRVFAQRQSTAKSRLAALRAISPSAHAELKELSSTLTRADDELARNARAFAALPSTSPPEDWELSWGGKLVPEALSASKAALQLASQQLEEARQRLATMTRTQSELQAAMSELHAWAQKVVEHRHSDANCPLCGTAFPPGELVARMQTLFSVPADAAVSELRQQIEHLAAHQTRTSNDTNWLVQLEKFLRASGAAEFTVREAEQSALNQRERQRLLQEATETAREGIEAYARAGVSLEAIEQLCAPIEGDDSPRPPTVGVLEALSLNQEFLDKLEFDLRELDDRVQQRNREVRVRLDAVGIPQSNSLAASIEQLMERQRIAQQASNVCGDVSVFLDLPPSKDLSTLSGALEAAVLGAKKVLATVQTDRESSTRLSAVNEELQKLFDRITRLGGAIERLGSALRALDDIIERQSLDAANAAVVAATHKVADSIFKRIHVPAEYFVTGDAETPLRRRDNNSATQLNQVSTGQRAAYALSMFLAMNAQVKMGPKAILLDDPISHIDDLNALSFLDYLRNLVLKSNRQVFFATADEKIAGLFAHKFGFLDGEFKTIELTRL